MAVEKKKKRKNPYVRKRANRFRNFYRPNLEENLFKWTKNEPDEGRLMSTIKSRLRAKDMVSDECFRSNDYFRF